MLQLTMHAGALHDYETSSRREWLVTNGIGGYASSSVSGANTRRYHGLLVAAVRPPAERFCTLSRLGETVQTGRDCVDLGTNDYPGTLHPQGYRLLERFDAYPVPTFFYRVSPGVLLCKRIWMAYRRNTTYVEYHLQESPGPVVLTVRPLVCWKSYHSEMRARDGFPEAVDTDGDTLVIHLAPGAAPLRLRMEGAAWRPAGYWCYNVQHQRERERGMEWVEDLYCPGGFDIELAPGERCVLTASMEDKWGAPSAELKFLEFRQRELLRAADAQGDLESSLVLAAPAYVVSGNRDGSLRDTIIAGYPWFTDWGRDTMIALPGLCLEIGRFAVARRILTSFARYVDCGMLPNRFPDYGEEPEYNTVDATLLYFEAIRRCIELGDCGAALAEELLPVLVDIVEWHRRGTRFGIRVDERDGLLRAGEAGVQLTWMDARVDGRVITPRTGKAVEINALWISALRTVARLCDLVGRPGGDFADAADRAARSFRRAFVRPDGAGLYDVIGDDGAPDPAIRPNQVLAAALPLGPLNEAEVRAVVAIAERHLLTPVGLRTLSPEDPAYCGRYEGGPAERDAAYHQGTVWPWLMGPYVEAFLRAGRSRKRAAALLQAFRGELMAAGIGQLSEVYDGDAPHRPGGCIAQAWSVGEVLRAVRLVRD